LHTDIQIDIDGVAIIPGGILIDEDNLMRLHTKVLEKVSEKFDKICKEMDVDEIE